MKHRRRDQDIEDVGNNLRNLREREATDPTEEIDIDYTEEDA